MATTVGSYEGFTLHLRVPLLVQEGTDRDKSCPSDSECCSTNSMRDPYNAHTDAPSAVPQLEGKEMFSPTLKTHDASPLIVAQLMLGVPLHL